MAIRLWQIAVLGGVLAGAVLSLLSLAVGVAFALFVPLTILAAGRDVARLRR